MDSKLLQFLNDPNSYKHAPGSIEHIQTHISHVFIAGPFVYKFKKPVNFEFLDFSTLDKRKHYCYREVELNRRLCDNIYLGVVTVREEGGNYNIDSSGNGRIVEYAVKMKKLSEEHFLPSYIERDELSTGHLDRIAEKLSAFYNEQETGKEIKQWGEIEKIRYNTDENFRQTKSFVGDTIDETGYRSIQKYTEEYYKRFDTLFDRRIRNNCIVDGHGDLHLEHIHITPEKVRIYDCIEFNDRFRYGDTAADLAFLAMDLDFNRCRREERYFMNRMAELLNDADLLLHLDFYKCYRAYVKGKVKSLQSAEEEVEEENRKKARHKAREYFDLSLRYATLGSRPTVMVVMGRIATGKSTVATALSDKLNVDHYSSDRIRKNLMGVPLKERTDASRRQQMYTRDMSIKTYGRLLKQAEKHIDRRESVILDATYSRKEDRQHLVDRMASLEADFYFIEVQANDETVLKRLQAREEREDVISDARIEDFEELSSHYEPPEEIHSDHIIRLDTNRKLEASLSELYDNLMALNLDKVSAEVKGEV